MTDELDRLLAAFMADQDDAPEKKYLVMPPENYRALMENKEFRDMAGQQAASHLDGRPSEILVTHTLW